MSNRKVFRSMNLIRRITRQPYSVFLWFFAVYLGVFFILEKITLNYYTVWMPLDDSIPYCSVFFVPYFSWYFVFFGLPVLFLLRDTGDYLRLCLIQFVPVALCCLIYFIWPTNLELRPEQPDGIFGWAVAALYRTDPPANVCPSIHVCSSFAAAVGLSLSGRYSLRTKILFDLWMLLIIFSTVFLRQHSVIDVIWGILIELPFIAFSLTAKGKKVLQLT